MGAKCPPALDIVQLCSTLMVSDGDRTFDSDQSPDGGPLRVG